MDLNKAFAYLLLTVTVLSVALIPSIGVTQNDENENNGDEEGFISLGQYSKEQLIDLAYTIRNITLPILNWSMSYNSTLATRILQNGDRFLNLALNETNETLAKTYAFVAAITYSHAPVTAYQVLAKVIRAEGELDWEIRVKKFYNLTVEFRSVTGNVVSIAKEFNVTIPKAVEAKLIIADGLINTTRELIEREFYRHAFRLLMRAYHMLVSTNSVVIRATFVQKLSLNVPPEEPISGRLYRWRVRKEILERICDRLPRDLGEKLKEKIRRGEIRNWRELREEARRMIQEYRSYAEEKAVEIVVRILLELIRVARFNPETRNAVNSWLNTKGFLSNGRINESALKGYLTELVVNVKNEKNVSGINLLVESTVRLQNEIGVDLLSLLQRMVRSEAGRR